MATITDVSPLKASRGVAGDLVTLKGTGFGAVQGAGTLTIGEASAVPVAATVVSWADTTITCRIGATAEYGAADIVLTPDGGTAVTREKGIMVIDTTDNRGTTDIEDGKIARIYVDGRDMGYARNDVRWHPIKQTRPVQPNDRNSPVKYLTQGRQDTFAFELLQWTGANLQDVLGGEWDSTDTVLRLTPNDELEEHSLAIVYANGDILLIKRCHILDPGEFVWNPGEEKAIPVAGEALGLTDPDEPHIELKVA